MPDSAQRVLITGVYGLIGNVIYRRLLHVPSSYNVFGLARRQQPSARLPHEHMQSVPDERFFIANLTDRAALQHALQGMDVVVHMAADPSGGASWESVLQNNIFHCLSQSAYNMADIQHARDVLGYTPQDTLPRT